MEIKNIYIQENLKVSDEILDSINLLQSNDSVIFVFNIPILSIIRNQPFDKEFFIKISEIYGIEKTVNKFFGLLRCMYDIDAKGFIFSSNNQLSRYQEAVNHNLDLLKRNPKMHLLKDGKIIIEGMINLSKFNALI